MQKIKDLKYYILISTLAALLYVPFIGRVHLFDWDEINFAESAREMLVTGDYLTVQIDYHAFWEKPPLFIWMQALSMKVFGVNEFAARFPNAFCGIITLLLLFRIGSKVRNRTFALFWVLSYGASVLPFLYFKSGIIDPWFNLFIFTGIHYFIVFYQTQSYKPLCLSAFVIGLAVLTKGPAGALIYGLTIFVFLIFHRFKIKIKFKHVLLFVVFFVISGGFWFILQILNGNWTVIQDFIVYQIRLFKTQDAGHGGFLLYHFVILLIGVFPASVFAISPLSKKYGPDENIDHYTQWMKILFWVVLILFTIVRTKIVHYSSMCYFPLTFLSARFLEKWADKKTGPGIAQRTIFYIVAFILVVIAIGVPLFGLYKDDILSMDLIKDKFMVANLQANVVWTGFEILTAIPLVTGIILYYVKRNNKALAVYLLYAGVALFTLLFLLVNVKKIEGYSQRAVIDFYKSKENERCYIKTIGFKSYAHYFYKKQTPPENRNIYYDNNRILTGEIDKTAYFVTKIKDGKKLEKRAAGDLEFIKEKNGYLFYKREPKDND